MPLASLCDLSGRGISFKLALGDSLPKGELGSPVTQVWEMLWDVRFLLETLDSTAKDAVSCTHSTLPQSQTMSFFKKSCILALER